MTKKEAQRVKDIKAVSFTELANKKEAYAKRTGQEVIDFSIGSSNIPPCSAVRNTLSRAALEDDAYQYSLKAMPEMKEAIQQWYASRYGVNLADDEIFLLKGSQEALSHLPMACCNPGDTVLIPDPYYPIYGTAPNLAGAKIQYAPLKEENDYLMQLDQIENPDDITMMMVSYPNNPTGAKAPDSFYKELISFARKHDILVVHDNAYSELVFEGEKGKSFLAFEGAKEIGVELNSFSKSYSMGGARLAVLCGNAEAIATFGKLMDMIDFSVFPPIQQAGIAALKTEDSFTSEVCAEYKRRRDLLLKEFENAGWRIRRPEGTMFVWAPVPEQYPTAVAFSNALLEQSGVLVNPGSSFGQEGARYVRMALVRSDEEVKEAARRIRESGVLTARMP